MVFPTADMPLTHILVVSDVERSRAWYTEVLGAELYREYGGDSAVLSFNGAWLLLVNGAEPTDDKATVGLARRRVRIGSTISSRSGFPIAELSTRRSLVAAPNSSRPRSITAPRPGASSGIPTVISSRSASTEADQVE